MRASGSGNGGVYVIFNVQALRAYIGKAEIYQTRLINHRSLLNQGRHHNQGLQIAWTRQQGEGFLWIEAITLCGPLIETSRVPGFSLKWISTEEWYRFPGIPSLDSTERYLHRLYTDTFLREDTYNTAPLLQKYKTQPAEMAARTAATHWINGFQRDRERHGYR